MAGLPLSAGVQFLTVLSWTAEFPRSVETRPMSHMPPVAERIAPVT